MNSNVIEIVTILVQKLLHNEDLETNEEEIIQGLLDLGYNLKDIEVAFELIFSSAEIIGVSENYENHTYLPTSERVFSARERYAFSVEAQSILYQLLQNKLITSEEFEEIIKRSITSSVLEIGSKELWFFLKTIVKENLRLSMIKNQISAFKELKDEQNFWIH